MRDAPVPVVGRDIKQLLMRREIKIQADVMEVLGAVVALIRPNCLALLVTVNGLTGNALAEALSTLVDTCQSMPMNVSELLKNIIRCVIHLLP